jgi:hypothetical protein
MLYSDDLVSNMLGHCDGTRHKDVLEGLQKCASQNGAPEPLFPRNNVTNTFSSPTKFWVTLCIPEPIFFRKIALIICIVKNSLHKST